MRNTSKVVQTVKEWKNAMKIDSAKSKVRTQGNRKRRVPHINVFIHARTDMYYRFNVVRTS